MPKTISTQNVPVNVDTSDLDAKLAAVDVARKQLETAIAALRKTQITVTLDEPTASNE